jgi:excinuclease ABC subunit C
MAGKSQNLWKNLPDSPGVYVMKDALGEILYVGKAGNLKRRVSSYFLRPHEYRLERLVQSIDKIQIHKTDTAIEALILEAELIKKLKPPYNVREKDDKSFLFIEITKEKFPRVLLTRGKEKLELEHGKSTFFGPFTSATNIREALKILRRIFPWSTHPPEKIGTLKRPCFEYEIGLCPGTCVNAISREDYMRNIQNLKLIFQGKKEKILKSLNKDMKMAAKKEEFERAVELRRQIFALNHIRDVSLIQEEGPAFHATKSRIEGYDISNISGTSSVGSMVVFINGYPDKNEYRKFRIKTLTGANDVGMLKEVLRRRFSHAGESGSWPLPNLILIDGGTGQVHGAQKVLNEIGLNIPVVGIAKGAERKRNDLIGRKPEGVDLETLIKVRDEAHRFAISYHKKLRDKRFLGIEK